MVIFSFILQIPFFPIVKKDLTFLHLGNDTYVDNLVSRETSLQLLKQITVNKNRLIDIL